MLRENFNRNWKCFDGSVSMVERLQMEQADSAFITLPHDAMIHEERTRHTQNGGQTGFYPGGNYEYVKTFYVPEERKNQTIVLEFEGVYQTAMIYVNDALAETKLYGYSNFYVTLDPYLIYGADNTIKVIADNAAEKNSRWYSGSGLYRSVQLLIGNMIHIPADGVRILPTEITDTSAVVEVSTLLRNLCRQKEKIYLSLSIQLNGNTVCSDQTTVTLFGNSEELVRQRYRIENPALWSCETPVLYDCILTVLSGDTELDRVQEHFGIRSLALDAVNGLRINGKPVKLRGTCLHHDNGIIGAATFGRAEERKCEILKQAGFNSIRSAHHPASKALLEACDRLGILVMDELFDMWTNHKNPHDFALHFNDCWREEAARMVAKDYNHPCVIMYSIGNEIQEVGTDHGKHINRMLANELHRLDASRYVTNGIHGMIAASERMGEIVAELMAQHPTELSQPKPATPTGEDGPSDSGSNGLNSYTDLLVGVAGTFVACHPIMSQCVEECIQPLDIAGYNYLTARYAFEKHAHPQKPVVGTETFPSEMVTIWKDARKNPHFLGEFTWIGYDYLGEAGAGIFYYDGKQNFGEHWPDRTAYVCDINLIGYRRPLSYLREIVFGLRKTPYIAVERVDRYGQKHSQNPWIVKDSIASWTWPGFEGKPASVDVYSDAETVELFLNGRSLGQKSAGEANGYTATYELYYEPGELLVISYADEKECGRFALQTAEPEVILSAEVDRTVLSADGEDLAFVTIKLVDHKGIDNLFAKKKVSIQVEGCGTLQGFGNADPQALGSYDDTEWETFDGYLLAAVRAGYEPGMIYVSIDAEGCNSVQLSIETIR